MKLFHGSSIVVKKPETIKNGFYKDFGFGFYCTLFEKQARRWALTKKNRHVVNEYSYDESNDMNKLLFPEMSEAWLQFVVDCRRGIEHQYDIVEGPMADDTIWDYIEDYAAGMISKAAFWELVKFRYPTHQIVFCSEKSLELLHFEGSYEL